MRWLWFLGSLVCFAVTFRTTSIALALICLIGALAFMLIGTLAVAAQRIDRNRNDDVSLLGPDELRHIRETEARRKAAAAGHVETPAIVGVAAASAMIAAESTGRNASGGPVEPPATHDGDSD